MSTNGEYRVVIEKYTKTHFLKDFEKKYKGAWLATLKAITSQLRNVDMLLASGRTNPPIVVSPDRNKMLIKHPFSVAGTKKSPKSSGCRLIAYVDHEIRLVRILLIYHKSHVPKNQQETVWWRQIIKSEYPGYDII